MNYPQRKLNRLQGYNYSNENYYFVTICIKERQMLLSTIKENVQTLSNYGKIAEQHLKNIEKHFEGIVVDKYTIMPNHIHAIIIIGCQGKTERSRPFPTLSTIIGLYKSGVSKEIGFSIWQKSFHDHIIRNKTDYHKIWTYIDQNPLKWANDCFYITANEQKIAKTN